MHCKPEQVSDLAPDRSIFSMLAMETPQYYAEPMKWIF